MNQVKTKTSSNSLFRNLFCNYFMFLLLGLGGHSSFAQTNTLDSLHTLLSNTTKDSKRLDVLDELIDELINIDLEKAQAYAQESLDLSRQIGDQVNEVKALNKMGRVLYETAERNSSLEYFEKSEQLAEKLDMRELQTHNLMSIANFYRYVTRDSAKTVNHLLKSAAVSKTINFHWGTGRSYAKLASFYTRYNQIDLCEKYLDSAAEYYIQYPNGEKTIAHYYNEVGDKIWDTNPKKSMDLFFKGKEYASIPSLMVSLAKAHNYIGEHTTALNYLKEAIPILQKKEKRSRMLSIAISQLAEVYIELGDYPAAKKTSDDGIELLRNLGRSDQRALPALYKVEGIIMEEEGNDKAALEYYTKSYEEAIRIKYGFARIKGFLTLGIFYSTRDLNKGEKYCRKSLKDAKKRSYTNLEAKACDCLYNIYKEKKLYVDALMYHEQKTILKDSLSTMNVRYALDINNKITEKDNLIAEQSYQKELKEKELRNQYILMFFGLLLIGVLAMSHRRISKQNKEINEKTDEIVKANLSLERSNEELERFAHITSHDLKTPIRSIVGFTALLRRKLKKEERPDVSELLDFIENGGKRMNQLIEDVLEYSKLSGDVMVEKEVVNLNQLVDEITKLVQSMSNSKSVIFEVSELPNIEWHHSRIFLLLKNIIENGIKYNQSEDPMIKIYCKNTSGVNSIYIEDNGIGIKKEYFERIFVMFNRLHTQGEYEGTGLGLATCKKIVDEFEGKISISSEINKGTIFKIELPNELVHLPISIDTEVPNVLQEV